MDWLYAQTEPIKYMPGPRVGERHPMTRGLLIYFQVWDGPRRRTLNISAQLKTLGLPEFEGRQHSGIDVSGVFRFLPKASSYACEITQDSRNIAKIVAELAQRGVSLYPNTAIHPNRRWHWMGKSGQVLEECFSI